MTRSRAGRGESDEIDSATAAAWWSTLAAGLVVAVVVWALLERLRRSVLDVEREVEGVWATGKRLAQNTQAAHMLNTVAHKAGELSEEIGAMRE